MEKRQKRLYTKLLLIYTGVTLGVISVLAAVFLSNFRMRTLESNQNYIDMLGKDVSDYVQDAKSEVDYIVRDLYKSTTELDDLLYYLTEDTQTYLKHALDEYYRQGGSVYKGIDDFIAETFSGNPHIIRITLLSHFNKDVTTHYPDKRIWHSADYNMVVNRLENNDLARKGEFSFVREIRDPVTWETSGYMIVTFSSDALENYYNFYSRADLLVFNSEGTVVYNSQGDDEAAKIVIPEHESEEVWEKNLNAYVNTSAVNDYRVISYMPKKQAEKMSKAVWLPVLLFSFAALVISQMLIRYYLGRMERRLNAIIEGMEQVTRGNLDIILKTNQKGDELDIISEHFNSMCRRLDRYIQKSYLAEIEQTNAEMEALQTQINPHFLYNTLEAIRMKAICSGDRDVAKMIYSMTVMFRSQVKESSVITLVQELHYCKKYLDLFKIRYENQFEADIECPEELYQLPVIKFVLQPIVENYFVHGMRKEDSDNYLKIQVEQEDEEICVVIEDNGHGMTEAELKKKNHELAENKKSEGKHSIGIANVNRRIKMVYGNQYGLRLEHAGERGLRVILRYKPEKDVTGNEETGNEKTGNEETGNKETENETQKG